MERKILNIKTRYELISEAANLIDKKNINTIYRFLIYLSFADGIFHPNEHDLLIKVRDAFGISEKTADDLLEELILFEAEL